MANSQGMGENGQTSTETNKLKEDHGPSESDILLFQKVKKSAGKNFEKELLSCVDEISRVNLFRKSFKWVPQAFGGNLAAFQKNDEYSKKLREKANVHFKVGEFQLALRGYNLAIVFASVLPMEEEPIEYSEPVLALTFGNRSAVWTSLRKWTAALQDIQLAIKYGYPSHLLHKLEIRRSKCEEMLKVEDPKAAATSKDGKTMKYKNNTLFRIANPNPLMPAAENVVTIQIHPVKGRQLIVTSDIPAGTTLIVEEPFVKVLQKELKWDFKHCHHCFKAISNGFPCSGCVFAVYCDEKCAADARENYHLYECPCMPYLHTSKTPAYTRMAFRIIFIIGPKELYNLFTRENANDNNLKPEGQTSAEMYDSSSYSTVYNLISHTTALSPVENFTNILKGIMLAQVLEEFTGFYSKIKYENGRTAEGFKDFIAATILHYLERVACNGISLRECTSQKASLDKQSPALAEELGGGIYGLSSLLNHSCFPNVTRIHESSHGKMAIVSTMYLKKGQELLTTYTKIFYHHPLKDRIEYLKNNFNFICDCVACKENWPLLGPLEKIHPVFICSASSCSALDSPKLALDAAGYCGNCGFKYDLLKLMDDFHYQTKCFHQANQLIVDNRPLEAIQILKQCLKFFQTSMSSPSSTFVIAQDLLKQAMELIVKIGN